MDACKDCYPVRFTSCFTQEVELGLEGNTTYYLWVYDHFNNVYVVSVTTDGNGSFIFDPNDFPEGLFAVGSFVIYISDNDDTNSREPFNVEEQAYNCVLLTYSSIKILEYLLLEDGSYLLLENNKKIILE